ncbi:MAG: VOC family protein [Sphingobium sp.]
MTLNAADTPDIQPCSRLKISEIILKTGQIDIMKPWYEKILGVGPFFEHAPDSGVKPGDFGGQTRASDLRMCFFRLSLDYPYVQTIGLFEEPGTATGPLPKGIQGLHHMQMCVAGHQALADKYEELKALGLTPHRSSDHGPMVSFYYRDPDGNNVEITAQNFPTLAQMVEFMASAEFAANPSGAEIDAEQWVARVRARA